MNLVLYCGRSPLLEMGKLFEIDIHQNKRRKIYCASGHPQHKKWDNLTQPYKK